uniref:Uncharacterized protein n=1 Tax=Arundo donax TaxID=35708 RepID=A0A0A9E8Y7_ARUDO
MKETSDGRLDCYITSDILHRLDTHTVESTSQQLITDRSEYN